MEDSPSGLWRTLGKRVGCKPSRVQISYPPPGLEPRKPLKSFGFRGFALVPPDSRFPPGTLRSDTSGPRPAARVTYRNRRFRKRLRAGEVIPLRLDACAGCPAITRLHADRHLIGDILTLLNGVRGCGGDGGVNFGTPAGSYLSRTITTTDLFTFTIFTMGSFHLLMSS